MKEVRQLLKGLTTAVRLDGLPNRWLCTEISAYCDLSPPVIEQVVRSRTGVVIDHFPCSLEISHEFGCTWIGVDLLTLFDMQPKSA